MELMKKLNNATGSVGLQLKKHSPEILMGVGVVSFFGTIILACRATTRAEEILDKHAHEMENIKEAAAVAEADDMYDDRKDKIIVYTHTATDMAKLYAPAIAAGTLTLGCFLKAYSIINGRYLGVVAAYNGLSLAFDAYRQRVKEELGDQMDRHFRYGCTEDTIEVSTDKGDGKGFKTTKEKVENTDRGSISQYAKFFDRSCPEWDENASFNMRWLRANETAANDILNSRGHIFLNEVYDMIGLPHTSEGAMVGWLEKGRKGSGDGYVDFGLYDPNNDSARRFVNGEDNVVLLDFNVDGIIFDKI